MGLSYKFLVGGGLEGDFSVVLWSKTKPWTELNNYLILVPLAMTFVFILLSSKQFSSHNNPLSSIMYCQQQYTMKCDRLFRTLCPGRLDIVDDNIVGFTEHCSGLSDTLCPTIWSR